MPLKAVETVFAPDSSGFSTSRFVRCYEEKYGTERSGHDWVKAHAIIGTKTNIVTAVEIADRDANDSPFFKPLVERTAQNFTVKDLGELSPENWEAFHRTVVLPNVVPERKPGRYAVSVRKRAHRSAHAFSGNDHNR